MFQFVSSNPQKLICKNTFQYASNHQKLQLYKYILNSFSSKITIVQHILKSAKKCSKTCFQFFSFQNDYCGAYLGFSANLITESNPGFSNCRQMIKELCKKRNKDPTIVLFGCLKVVPVLLILIDHRLVFADPIYIFSLFDKKYMCTTCNILTCYWRSSRSQNSW